ncbi:MAG: hypothetical protein JOY78_04120 [Pseudonocardia sp.]|nr:hypothetical protein [Pseudonocardia sp.]
MPISPAAARRPRDPGEPEQVLAHRQAVHGLGERRSSHDALGILPALPAALSARPADPLHPPPTHHGWALPPARTVGDAPPCSAAPMLGRQRTRQAEVDAPPAGRTAPSIGVTASRSLDGAGRRWRPKRSGSGVVRGTREVNVG